MDNRDYSPSALTADTRVSVQKIDISSLLHSKMECKFEYTILIAKV